MKHEHCIFEEKTAVASRSGQWSDALLAHIADCRSCEEVALVAGFFCESAGSAPVSAELPDPGRIWMKARIAANAAAMERALLPILWARRIAFGSGVVAIVVAIVLAWSRIAGFVSSFANLWQARPVSSAGHDNFPLVMMAAFLLILIPLIFGLYASWSED